MLKLEEGKRYVRRDGVVTGKLKYNPIPYYCYSYIDINNEKRWNINGKYLYLDKAHNFDLIKEYKEMTPYQKATLDKIKVMQAYVDGEEIQIFVKEKFGKGELGRWENVVNPAWNWLEFNYRIKPKDLIEIDGKQYNKQDVMDRLKELPTINK